MTGKLSERGGTTCGDDLQDLRGISAMQRAALFALDTLLEALSLVHKLLIRPTTNAYSSTRDCGFR